MYRIEVSVKEGFDDPRAEGLEKDILDLGITAVERITVSDIYLLEGELSESDVATICRELLADPIVEEYSYVEKPVPADACLIEVAYNPGVMDPAEESVKKESGTSVLLPSMLCGQLKNTSSGENSRRIPFSPSVISYSSTASSST